MARISDSVGAIVTKVEKGEDIVRLRDVFVSAAWFRYMDALRWTRKVTWSRRSNPLTLSHEHSAENLNLNRARRSSPIENSL